MANLSVYQRRSLCEDHKKFVQERFPNAGLIYFLDTYNFRPVHVFSYMVTDQKPSGVKVEREYMHSGEYQYLFSNDDGLGGREFQCLGKTRACPLTAWKSAHDELVKYEQGRKSTPFIKIITRFGILGQGKQSTSQSSI